MITFIFMYICMYNAHRSGYWGFGRALTWTLGCGGVGGDSSLLQLSVQMVRQALQGQHRQEAAAAAPDVEGVGEYGAVWPAIWRREAQQRGLSGHVAGHGGAGEDEGQGNMDPTEQAVQGDGRDAPSPQQCPEYDNKLLLRYFS